MSRTNARNKESKLILSFSRHFGGEPVSIDFKDHELSLCRGCG